MEWKLVWMLAGMAGLLFGGIFCIKWLCLRKALLRLQKEWEHCQSRATNRLLPEVSADPALKDLVRSLNASLKELKKGRFDLERQKRFFFTQTANAAHDFKTPLAAALGYLQLAQSEEDPQKKEHDLVIARERLARLKAISADLFDLARLQDPDTALPLTPILLSRPLEEALLALLPLFEQKGIEPVIHIEECMVFGSAQAMDQVFSNLLGNALKYASGKTLHIQVLRSGEVRFRNVVEDLYWSDVEKVFERYYSVGQNRQSHGLGLGIAKALMEKMDGTLSVSMENGEIEFCCRFRLADLPENPAFKHNN